MTAPIVARAARAARGGGGGGPRGPQSRGGRLALGIVLLWCGAFCISLAVGGRLAGRKWTPEKSGLAQLGDVVGIVLGGVR